MNGFGTLLIVGIVMYFLFSRNGAVGCCGGHMNHGSRGREPDPPTPEDRRQPRLQENVIDLEPKKVPVDRSKEEIIDLKPGDYKIIETRSRS